LNKSCGNLFISIQSIIINVALMDNVEHVF